MSNTTLESITSVCTTPQELIKSPDFIRGVEIILGQVKTFDKEHILSLFKKLQNDEVLNDEDKGEIELFVSNERVSKLGQKLLSKLQNVSVNVKTKDTTELLDFGQLLSEIFAEDGYKKVQGYIGKVANIAKLTLNTYEGMDELTLTLSNGETKKVHVKLFIEAEDSALTHTLSNGATSNFPKSEIKNNPALITRNKRGHYHFGYTASENRLKELGMRAFTDEEMDSPELSKYIAENVKLFPGFRRTNGSDFGHVKDNACFWGASTDGDDASFIEFYSGNSKAYCFMTNKSLGFSLFGVKD